MKERGYLMCPPNDNGFNRCCPSGNTMIDLGGHTPDSYEPETDSSRDYDDDCE